MLQQTRELLQRAASSFRLVLAIGLLLLITLLVGCGDDSEAKNDGGDKPLYGPPPAEAGVDATRLPDAGLDALHPGDARADAPCEPLALYGPPPCASDSDCVQWMGDGWYCDKDNSFDNGCGGTSNWAICRQETTKDAGVAPDGCLPVSLYGPQPCSADSDCVNQYGDGWYCDKDNSFGDGCGGTTNWPICREDTTKDAGVVPDGCMPVALYGPQPCATDDDCVQWYGSGYTCNTDNSFSDGCGGTITWPTCEKPQS